MPHIDMSSASDELSELKRSLQDKHLYTPSSGDTPASHDDATLLRFLRARKFDPVKAHKQFAATEAWRVKLDVLNLYATFDPDELESAKRFYPRWTGRRDKHGIPVYVFRLASLSGTLQKELNAAPEEPPDSVALWEFMSRFTLPLCSALPHSPLVPSSPDAPSSVTSSLPSPASCHRDDQASELATAHYPETLHTIAVVNAPSFFPTVWSWIKAWFDEGTRNKVHVLGADPSPVLLQLMDADSLPQVYGGTLPFTFEDEPILDTPARELLGSDEIPRGPIVFVDGKVARPEGHPEPPYALNGSAETST
ncbi:hypothetical protein EDB83DRAFT_2356836 [Lactarius deliciosus]|nr:hypothetical protein EDB83DRAFT_2356836 [Lactarius deliciosus]